MYALRILIYKLRATNTMSALNFINLLFKFVASQVEGIKSLPIK